MGTLALDNLAQSVRKIVAFNAAAKIAPQLQASDTELSEEYLTRKFLRPANNLESVNYELTRDPALLHQYYMLREQMFISVWGLDNFSGKQDEFDADSDIMVARLGNQVIGGCRLTFSRPNHPRRLPMEKEFLISDLLPELPLEDCIHVEISRMAILPEFQNTLAMLEISRQLLMRGAAQKARYAFTLAPVPLARNYRKAAYLFGLNWQIRNDVKIPDREEYEGIKMVLSMLDLAPVYASKPANNNAKMELSE